MGEGRSRQQQGHIFRGLVALGLVGAIALPAMADVSPEGEHSGVPTPLRAPTACPQDLPTLTAGLLRDLPSYANRVAMRTLGVSAIGDSSFGSVLVAGQPEFDPLPLSTVGADIPGAIAAADPTAHQVFFTTWERRYTPTEIHYLEQYHWLFLSQAADGWRLSLMFSRLRADANTVSAASLRPPSPPQESSEGIVGQAVQLWLRDCRAGAIAPLSAPEPPSSTAR